MASQSLPAHGWAVLGSAALALHGLEYPKSVDDVDVACSGPVAGTFLRLGAKHVTGQSEGAQFRSSPYARVSVPGGLTIDVMGNFHFRPRLRDGGLGGWVGADLTDAHWLVLPSGRSLRVLSLESLVSQMAMFGRPKDLRRLQRLGLQG